MITKIYKSKQRKSTWQNLRNGILIFIFFASMNSAKALVANYAFASSVSNYSTLAGTTFVTGTWDDSSSALITLPFTFNYNNTNYTTLSINTNGYVTFGAVPATVYCGLQSSAPNTIAAYGTDLIGNAGSTIQYGSRGALPSRQFVIQWADCEHYLNGGVNHWNFQIILNEGTNTVQVVWGASTH